MHARYIGSDMGQSALEMTLNCLRAMSNGGIHDHVGQVRGRERERERGGRGREGERERGERERGREGEGV